jgi:TolA-binding protein
MGLINTVPTGMRHTSRGWVVGVFLLAACGTCQWERRCCAQEKQAEELESYQLGIGFYERERYRQAAESLSAFLKQSPQSPKAENAAFVLGLSQVRLEEFAKARETFTRFLKQYPQAKRGNQARYWLGHCAYHLQDYPAAVAELGAFVQANPADTYLAYALPYLGESQLKQGAAQAALGAFDQALQKFPQGAMVADAEYGRARALLALKDSTAAAAAFRAIHEKPGHEFANEARLSHGNLLFEQKEYRQAADLFRLAEEQAPAGPQRGRAALNLGFSLSEAGDLAAAEAPFRRATESTEVAAEAALWLGLTLKKQKKYQPAIEWLATAYPRFKQTSQAEQIQYQWGDTLLRQGSHSDAEKVFQTLLDDWPQGRLREETLHAATLAAVSAGQLAEAERWINRYQTDFPKGKLRLREAILSGRVALMKGLAAGRANQSDIARQLFTQAEQIQAQVVRDSEIESTRLQARYFWGEALLQLRDYTRTLEISAPLAEAVASGKTQGEFAEVYIQRGTAAVEQAKELARERSRTVESADRSALTKLSALARAESARYLGLQPPGPRAPAAWSLTAVASALEGDRSATLSALQALAQQFPKRVERETALLEVAELAYSREDYALAETLYAELVQLSVDAQRRPRALADLGWSRSQQKNYPGAIEAFSRLLSDHPQHELVPEAAFMVGQSHALSGQVREAQQAYARGFALPGDSDHVLQSGIRSGRLLFELNDIAGADAMYEAVLKRFAGNPRLDRVLDDWATRHYDAERFEEADRIYRRLIAECPNSPLCWNARVVVAESTLLAGRPREARPLFEEVVTAPGAEPRAVEQALHQLGNIAQELQDWSELQRVAAVSLERFPQGGFRHEATFALGEAEFMQGRYLAAQEIFNRLKTLQNDPEVANRPWFPKVFVRLADILVRDKRYAESDAVVAELTAWSPECPLLYQVWEVQGRGRKNQARFPEARKLFEQVVTDRHGRKTETAARAQLLLADTYVLEKNFEAALDEYLKVDIGYDFPYWQGAALYHAGTCQESLNDPAGAAKTYTRLVAKYSDSEFVPKARERLQVLRKGTSRP